LSISARNIDSRSSANKQQRFKRIGVPIRLFQISISQSPLDDFCNTITPKADFNGSLRDVAEVPARDMPWVQPEEGLAALCLQRIFAGIKH